jgi:hypothetical protein
LIYRQYASSKGKSAVRPSLHQLSSYLGTPAVLRTPTQRQPELRTRRSTKAHRPRAAGRLVPPAALVDGTRPTTVEQLLPLKSAVKLDVEALIA